MSLNKPSLHIAKELIKQIEKQDAECLLWIVSSINRILLNDPSFSLLEYFDLICNVCPDITNQWKGIMISKELHVINDDGEDE